jgi:hypothetical protein
MQTWQLQEAKGKFSEVVKRAQSQGPQSTLGCLSENRQFVLHAELSLVAAAASKEKWEKWSLGLPLICNKVFEIADLMQSAYGSMRYIMIIGYVALCRFYTARLICKRKRGRYWRKSRVNLLRMPRSQLQSSNTGIQQDGPNFASRRKTTNTSKRLHTSSSNFSSFRNG